MIQEWNLEVARQVERYLVEVMPTRSDRDRREILEGLEELLERVRSSLGPEDPVRYAVRQLTED